MLMTIEDKKAAGLRAFTIRTPVRFPSGRRVGRSDYMETDDTALIELLGKASPSNVTEIPLRVTGPAPAPRPPAPAPTPEDAVQGEMMPEWAFTTIPKMRAWLDQCGVTPLGKRVNKAKHEEACVAAWESGLRPHPLYGMPGGAEPGPGFPGVPVTPESVAAAIKACEDACLEVPKATRAFLADDPQDEQDSAPEAENGAEAPADEATDPTEE